MRWDRHLAAARARHRARSLAERRAMDAVRRQWAADAEADRLPRHLVFQRLAVLESLKHLEALGLVSPRDSLDAVHTLKHVLARAYAGDAAPEALARALEQYGDRIEAYLKTYRDHVETYYRDPEAPPAEPTRDAAPRDAAPLDASPQGAA